ncbi:hypothetical protein J2S00_003047 [Caldalkalibacillus uzonensis]|uniref:Nucleotide pyrophosphohydrolase n=1 Tax=Caldalkalibacillus uzonensis TaxID=353224 RepID=A0ABU0CVS9_9BACI|nr:hypothetical protein [Caldalkalibacillus uzonensis]MDQ0340242.1 hypothetical protein [Caldalkalibacillus uzonensis]
MSDAIPSKVLMATAWGATEMIESLKRDIEWYTKGHAEAATADEIVRRIADILDILQFLEDHMYPPKIQWDQLRKIEDLKYFLPQVKIPPQLSEWKEYWKK